MSDEELYSKILEEKFTYTNTFFHQEPHLDIKDPRPDLRGRFNFVICAEVMEHVPPPMHIAFKNLNSLLRPGGLLILSVPYTNEAETLEHFPELHRFEILGSREGRYLVNTTEDGRQQTYHNLVFHGGKGTTLEMRVFSRTGVLKMLKDSGFREIQIHSESLPEWGSFIRTNSHCRLRRWAGRRESSCRSSMQSEGTFPNSVRVMIGDSGRVGPCSDVWNEGCILASKLGIGNSTGSRYREGTEIVQRPHCYPAFFWRARSQEVRHLAGRGRQPSSLSFHSPVKMPAGRVRLEA